MSENQHEQRPSGCECELDWPGHENGVCLSCREAGFETPNPEGW